MKFPHKSSVARVVQHRRRGFFAGFARCLRVSATSVAGRINQNAGHSLAGRVPTPEISHFCPRNASIYIIFPINSSGEALPTRLGTLLHRTYAPSFPPSCADSRAKHVLPERVHPPSLLYPIASARSRKELPLLHPWKRKSARWIHIQTHINLRFVDKINKIFSHKYSTKFPDSRINDSFQRINTD